MTLPIIIYTDGACSGNPGPGGWGAYLSNKDYKKEIYGSDTDTTNNRMELMGAIKGLEALKRPSKVELYTDSVYVKNGITLWIDKWLQNNWRNSHKELVKNVDLWQTLYELTKLHDVAWYWVKGHGSSAGNKIADALACKGRDEAKRNVGFK
jgi:ribonuclease HI